MEVKLAVTMLLLPYSWKYGRELNLALGSQIAIANVLAVRYGIVIYMYTILIWRLLMQTAKPPNLIPRQIFRLYGIFSYYYYYYYFSL